MTDGAERNVAEELTAIKAVADALEPLSSAGRRHVIAYVAEALGLAAPAPEQEQTPPSMPAADVLTGAVPPAASGRPIDIRTLKEQKEPQSANEMAALVAYYVSELLPPEEQQDVVTSAIIEKYFKQANFRLPSRVAQTLPDAARAGYFDAVDRGQYKLNPVGYNLVAHGMPSRGREPPAPASRPRKGTSGQTGKKVTRKKATAKTSTTKKAARAVPAKRRPSRRP